MKARFNPTNYMLLAYRNHMGDLYENSFKDNSKEMKFLKLKAFCTSLVSLMKFKEFNFRYTLSDKGLDIFLDNTLMVSYDTSIIENIKNENSLKFQLFVEWGLLIDLTKKEKALIAL